MAGPAPAFTIDDLYEMIIDLDGRAKKQDYRIGRLEQIGNERANRQDQMVEILNSCGEMLMEAGNDCDDIFDDVLEDGDTGEIPPESGSPGDTT